MIPHHRWSGAIGTIDPIVAWLYDVDIQLASTGCKFDFSMHFVVSWSLGAEKKSWPICEELVAWRSCRSIRPKTPASNPCVVGCLGWSIDNVSKRSKNQESVHRSTYFRWIDSRPFGKNLQLDTACTFVLPSAFRWWFADQPFVFVVNLKWRSSSPLFFLGYSKGASYVCWCVSPVRCSDPLQDVWKLRSNATDLQDAARGPRKKKKRKNDL